MLARGSLAAAVSHAYLERQARLEREALERDAGFGDPGDDKSSSKSKRKQAGASLMTEEDRLKEARREAINRCGRAGRLKGDKGAACGQQG